MSNKIKHWLKTRAPVICDQLFKVWYFSRMYSNYFHGLIKKILFPIYASRITKIKSKKFIKNNSNKDKFIKIITGYTETVKDIADITVGYLTTYCDFNNYDYSIYLDKDFNLKMPPAWSKIMF